MLCVLVVLLLCFAFVPKPVLAQTGIKVVRENMALVRADYPPVRPLGGSTRIYPGEWQLEFTVSNYDVEDPGSEGYATGFAADVSARVFLDDVLQGNTMEVSNEWWHVLFIGSPSYNIVCPLSMTQLGNHEILIQIWHGTEAQPQDMYSFNVTVAGPEISGWQANSRVVRAQGENLLAAAFTNGGNADMRKAVLSVADSGGLTIAPSEVELGDVKPGENASAIFTVSSPASVRIGTTQVQFSLSFIDYAGVSHTETVPGDVEVYRLSPTLSLSAPSSVENGSTAEIVATLTGPGGNPITNENITLRVGGVTIGSPKTDSDGIARLSYMATETGTFGIEASFIGSASYEASSASAVLAVTPATDTTWIIALLIGLAILVILVIALAVWRKRRKQIVKPARGTRKEAQESVKIGMVGIARGITAQRKAGIAGGKVEQTELGAEHG